MNTCEFFSLHHGHKCYLILDIPTKKMRKALRLNSSNSKILYLQNDELDITASYMCQKIKS